MLTKLSGAIREATGTTGQVCCFCAQEVESSQMLTLNVTYPDDSVQSLFAHHDCLGSKLDPSVPFLNHADWNQS